jgi:hypothetical protein
VFARHSVHIMQAASLQHRIGYSVHRQVELHSPPGVVVVHVAQCLTQQQAADVQPAHR